jgi:hypothetical protein
MTAVLVQIDGYDPVAAAAVSLRASSVDDERVCHLDGQTWWPAIAQLPALRYEFFEGAFAGGIVTPDSAVSIAAEPWPNFGRFILADARLRIWTGKAGDAWGGFTLRFDGRVLAQPNLAEGVAEIPFAVDDRWLDAPLLATYAGTGGAEGEAGQKGQPKPLALGAPRFVPGIMVDSVNNVLQLSAYGAIDAVETAFERVVRFGASAGDFASYAALVAATIPAGAWGTCLAAGLLRHGAAPVPPLTYHVKGDKAGPDGWTRLPGATIKRIALLAGGAGRFDEASMDALDAARPWPISLHVADQTTARMLIQRIAASVNAVAGVDWLGRLFVAPIGINAASVTLDATGASLPPTAPFEQVAVDAPFWRLAIGSEPSWFVHGLQDVAFTAPLVDRGAYNVAETYREGHIVQDQGWSWLYVNTAPSAGNAPPGLPATSNAWWRVFVQGGAGQFTLLHANTNTRSPSPTSAKKLSGATSYSDTAVYSQEAFTGGAFASCRAAQTNRNVYFGLNSDPPPAGALGTSRIDYSFFLKFDGTVDIRESNVIVAASVTTYTTADLFTVHYDGRRVRYLKNGVPLIAARTVATGIRLALDMILQAVPAELVDIAFGPAGTAGDDGVSPVLVTASPATHQVQCDAAGDPKPGELPKQFKFTAQQGAGAIALTSITITSTIGCTASVSGNSILLNVISADAGEIRYTVVAGGQSSSGKLTFSTSVEGGAGTVSAARTVSSQINYTSYTVHGTSVALSSSATGKIKVSLSGRYYAPEPETITCQFKVQYRTTGSGVWADVPGSERTGSQASWESEAGAPTVNIPGSLNVASVTLSGLTASTSYEFRIVDRKSSGSATTTQNLSLKLYVEQVE